MSPGRTRRRSPSPGGIPAAPRALDGRFRVRFLFVADLDAVDPGEFPVGVFAEDAHVPTSDIAAANPTVVVLDVGLVHALRGEVAGRALPEVGEGDGLVDASVFGSPLENLGERPIGELLGAVAFAPERRIWVVAINANEVLGYWAFLAGVVLGVLGLLLYYMTAAATMSRGIGYALAALAPALFMAGAVLRFPLHGTATTLVGTGLALTVAAIAWFLLGFPGGWSLTTGNSAVILSYVAGLAIIGVAGSVVPIATDARDTALSAAEQRAVSVETAGEDSTAAFRESERAGNEREAKLTAEIGGLRGDNANLRSSKAEFELYTDTDDQWRWRLVHGNGNIIADSGEGYSSKSMAKKGLGSVKLNALGAEISEG